MKNVDTIIPGHSPMMTPKDLQEYQRFTADLLAHAQAAMKAGQSVDEATATFKVDTYPGYKNERVKGSIRAVYDELKKYTIEVKPHAVLVVFAGLLIVSAGRASAQTDSSGTWTLDRNISGDLSKATFEPQQSQARRSTGGLTGGFGGLGGRGGFGGPSGAGGRRGSSGGDNRNDGNSRNGAAGLTVDERTRLRELTDYVKGFTSLVIVHSDNSGFAVTDAQGSSRLFPTDGSKTQHALATTTIDGRDGFTYQLVNTTDDEGVLAKLLPPH